MMPTQRAVPAGGEFGPVRAGTACIARLRRASGILIFVLTCDSARVKSCFEASTFARIRSHGQPTAYVRISLN